jgi:hypothetical protein
MARGVKLDGPDDDYRASQDEISQSSVTFWDLI